MNRRLSTPKLAELVATASLLCATAAPAWSQESVDERHAVDPEGTVLISNVAGTISVEGWDNSEVAVTGTLGRGVERLDFSSDRDGNRTIVKVILPERSHRSGGSDLLIKVPQSKEVSVNTVSADITSRGVDGRQRLETVSGDVSAHVLRGDLAAKSVSGELEVTGHGAETFVTVTLISGDAELVNLGGEVEANTVSGDIDVEQATLTRARVKTTSGDIELDGSLAAGGRLDAETINGDVDLDLDDTLDVEIDAETFNGDIENCMGAESTRKSQYGPGRTLHLRQGEADRSIHVKTLNGDIDICTAS